MHKTLNPSDRIQIEISAFLGFGLTLGYSVEYKEIMIIIGCFAIAIQFKQKRKRRNHG